MTNNPLQERKAVLRRELREGRKIAFECGESHSLRLIELVVRNGFKVVSAYQEFDNEPSLAAFRDWCEANGVEVLLPTMAADFELTWNTDDQPASLGDAELIVMPALAAGRDANRLGRGKGYYDRAVAGLAAPRVVVVHDSEILDTVPAEDFDQKVSMIVSCSETVDLDGRLN